MTNIELIKQEIERLQEAQLDECRNFNSAYEAGIFDGLCRLEEFIDSLPKEKEIDLDEEITKYWKDISSLYGAVGKEITRFDFDDVCRYFYQFGLNARKEE